MTTLCMNEGAYFLWITHYIIHTGIQYIHQAFKLSQLADNS